MNSIFQPNVSGEGIAWNTFVKAIITMLALVVEVYFARFLVGRLGHEIYGTIQIAANIGLFASIITYSIQGALGRQITIFTHQNKHEEAKKTFTVGFLGFLGISVFILLPIFSAVSWYCNELFRVPEESIASIRVLFASTLLSFVIVAGGSILSIGTFVYNRLDLIDALNLTKLVISRFIAFILISLAGFGLYGFSIGLVISSIVGLAIYIVFWKKITPNLKISRKDWDIELFRKMKSFALWLVIKQSGARALIFLDIIIVNWLYGVYETGLYGIAFFFSSKLRFLSGMFASLFNPLIVERYARNDIDGMVQIACKGIKMLGILFALPIGLFCGLYKPIFTIWVGEKYASLSWIAIVLTFHLGVNTSCFPLTSILTALDKMKVPAIVTLLNGFSNVLLATILGWPSLGIGMIGIAIAGAISLTVDAAIFNPLYVSRALKRSPKIFYKSFVPGIIGLILVSLLSYGFSRLVFSYKLSGLLIVIVIISMVFITFAWMVLIPLKDRQWLISMVNVRLKG